MGTLLRGGLSLIPIAIAIATGAGCRPVKFELTSVEVVSDPSQAPKDESRSRKAGYGRNIRMEFVTSDVLRERADEDGLNVSFRANICGEPNVELHYSPYIHDDAGEIGITLDDHKLARKRVWLFIREKAPDRKSIFTGREVEAYDLTINARDICVDVYARGWSFSSFDVSARMTAQQISDAINRANEINIAP